MFVLRVRRIGRYRACHTISRPKRLSPCLHYATLSLASVREAAAGAISFVRSSSDVSDVQRMFVCARATPFSQL